MGFVLLVFVTLVAYTLYNEEFKASAYAAADVAGGMAPSGRTEEDERLIPLNGAMSVGANAASTSASVTAKSDASMPADQMRTSRDRLVDSANN